MTQHVFNKHFDALKEDYQKVVIINLLRKEDKEEVKISEVLRELTINYTHPLKVLEFDFHDQTKHSNYHKLDHLIDMTEEDMLEFGFCMKENEQIMQN